MNNLEIMKQNVVSQIEKMNTKEFEKLMNILLECHEFNQEVLDISCLFTCDECRKKYGNCSMEANECSSRFEKYAMSKE